MGRRLSFSTIIVGQDSLLKEGCARILRSANFRILDSVLCAGDLLGKVHRDPALVLFVHTGNEFGSVAEQIRLFRNSHADARIAIVADRYRAAELVSVFRAGASGYFVEGITSEVFIKSLELVITGETVLPTAFLPDVLGRKEHRLDDHQAVLATDQITPQLSPREKLILHCLVEGYSNKSIAQKVDSSDATVKVHVKAILRKIRVHNRTQAAIWGMKNASRWRTSLDTAPPLVPQEIECETHLARRLRARGRGRARARSSSRLG